MQQIIKTEKEKMRKYDIICTILLIVTIVSFAITTYFYCSDIDFTDNKGFIYKEEKNSNNLISNIISIILNGGVLQIHKIYNISLDFTLSNFSKLHKKKEKIFEVMVSMILYSSILLLLILKVINTNWLVITCLIIIIIIFFSLVIKIQYSLANCLYKLYKSKNGKSDFNSFYFTFLNISLLFLIFIIVLCDFIKFISS
ncbi:hypothetical protein [Staphylococcus caeli]|uniref:Uncharacterized protein n=1 Tax=Staphylococcus caeli TaxID=2201815 RepID=A0A1D4PQ98_9STAP|nr:hypothetical protein [Staphylococcus caeli]SCT25118.1 Uncharacterised protein [Staphylococcus caeli]SCT31867.1 Uncharacterised protein [Staphylococcus caeli]